MLEEAEELHRSAGSHHARRAQLADVYFFLGQAQLRLGRSQAANETFVKMLKTYPGYAETRAGSVPSSVNSAMARAKTVRINQSRDLMDAGSADNMARRLRVQAVVSGVVDGNGQLAVRLFRGGRIEGEINRRLDTLPPFPGDPIYLEMVQQLMLNLGASSGRDGGFASPPDFGGSTSRDGFQDAPSFDSGSGPVSGKNGSHRSDARGRLGPGIARVSWQRPAAMVVFGVQGLPSLSQGESMSEVEVRWLKTGGYGQRGCSCCRRRCRSCASLELFGRRCSKHDRLFLHLNDRNRVSSLGGVQEEIRLGANPILNKERRLVPVQKYAFGGG